jgi:M6 family metalloprotease-like protein
MILQNRLYRALSVLLAVIMMLSILTPLTALAQEPVEEGRAASLEEQVAADAAAALGWPTTVWKKPLRESNSFDETFLMLWPPQSAVRYFNKPIYTATNGGDWGKETIQYLRVLPMGEQGSRDFIDTMIENGLPHSSYQGREGIVMPVGTPVCDPGGLLGYIIEQLRTGLTKFLEELFEEWDVDPNDVIITEGDCAEAAAGMIMWTCGSHIFIARDDTGSGAEDNIAAALWMAAESNQICDIGDSLVLLAGTADQPNAKTITDAQKLAQDTNSYYGANAYGRVVLGYTFMDADGKDGNADGYEVGPSMADYVSKECQFAQDAIKKAFEGGAPREEINLERAVVLYAGPSKQADATNGKLSTLCCWPQNGMWYDIEVGPDDNKSHIYASSLIMVAEQDGLGLWTHEVGHSLYSGNLLWDKFYRVSDRYNYSQPWGKYGNISNWGLMGSGNWWGDPMAAAPVQMSGFTKESAGWLSYLDGELDKEYTLTAVENQKAGGTVLRFDDPTSNDPNRYLILEARDAGAAFGAPESGVVLYQVTWDGANKHHIVNAISPQKGTTAGTGPRDRSYLRPTLRGAGDANAPTVFRSAAFKLEFQLVSESTASGYGATVKLVTWEPQAPVVGAVAAPAGPPAVPPPAAGQAQTTVPSGADGVLPDIDLHAYDGQGRHVGLDYATGQYVNEIPGAIASGDLKDAEEWIYVPEGTQVRFEISAYKTEQFLQSAPEFRDVIRPQGYEMTYQRIDENGVLTAAKGQGGKIEAGAESELEGPDAPGLKYKEVKAPGYGKNLPANLWWSGLLAALGLMFVAGWVVALARR